MASAERRNHLMLPKSDINGLFPKTTIIEVCASVSLAQYRMNDAV